MYFIGQNQFQLTRRTEPCRTNLNFADECIKNHNFQIPGSLEKSELVENFKCCRDRRKPRVCVFLSFCCFRFAASLPSLASTEHGAGRRLERISCCLLTILLVHISPHCCCCCANTLPRLQEKFKRKKPPQPTLQTLPQTRRRCCFQS